MKHLFPFVLLFLITVSSYAQETILEKQVPQAVKKAFVEKYPEVTSVEWFKNNDTVIGAKFSFNKKKTSAEYTTSGVFLSSSSEMTPKELPGMVSNYIRGNHRDDIVNLAMMNEKSDGKISYYVEIRKPGVAQAITKLYFDFYGNLTKIIQPEEIKIEKDAENGSDKDDLGADIASGQQISKKELPSTVSTYLDKNYKEYKFDKAIFIEDKKLGNLYEVKMRKIGYREFILVHFDLLGKYVEINQK